MNLDPCVQQLIHLHGNVRALAVHTEQMSANLKVGRMDGDVLRRQTLLDDAAHLVIGNGS